MVLRELVTAWRLAASPTKRSPVLVKATTDGVVRFPSEFSNTTGSPPSMTAMQELVVPKSIPITLAIKIQYIPAIQVPFNEYIYNMLIYSTLCYFFGLFVPKKIE